MKLTIAPDGKSAVTDSGVRLVAKPATFICIGCVGFDGAKCRIDNDAQCDGIIWAEDKTATPASARTCRYTYQPDTQDWEGSCGSGWRFEIGGPAATGWLWCPFCGGELVENNAGITGAKERSA